MSKYTTYLRSFTAIFQLILFTINTQCIKSINMSPLPDNLLRRENLLHIGNKC